MERNQEYWDEQARQQDALVSYGSWGNVARRYREQLQEAEGYMVEAAKRYLRAGGDVGVLEEQHRYLAELVEACKEGPLPVAPGAEPEQQRLEKRHSADAGHLHRYYPYAGRGIGPWGPYSRH